jgi:hypothetical protein
MENVMLDVDLIYLYILTKHVVLRNKSHEIYQKGSRKRKRERESHKTSSARGLTLPLT